MKDDLEAFAKHLEIALEAGNTARGIIIKRVIADLKALASQPRKKKTSSRVSSIAAKYIAIDMGKLGELTTDNGWDPVFKDIRSMAASLLSQDVVKGNKPDT